MRYVSFGHSMDIRLNVRYRLHSKKVSQYITFEYFRRHCFAVENRLGYQWFAQAWRELRPSEMIKRLPVKAFPMCNLLCHSALSFNVSVSNRRFDSPTALSGLVGRRRSVLPPSRTYLGTVSHIAFGAFGSCFLFTHTTGGISENVSCQTTDAHQVTA